MHASARTSPPSRRIVVVEDDPALRKLLNDSLSARGYDVRLAKDGREGRRLIEETLPHLAVVDVMLPGIDGFTLVDGLRGGAFTRHVPVIIVSARTDPRSMLEGLGRGATRYVSKPFKLVELLDEIDHVIETHDCA